MTQINPNFPYLKPISPLFVICNHSKARAAAADLSPFHLFSSFLSSYFIDLSLPFQGKHMFPSNTVKLCC
ncbi:hypothetical protein P8452_41377 [Trifolium repens]|nr:hypothetical protein P8452_41377 [Trifolium repens]